MKTLDLRDATECGAHRAESLVRARCLPRAHALSTMDPSRTMPPLELIFAQKDRPQIEDTIRTVASFQSATLNLCDWIDPFGDEQTGIVLRWT